MAHLLTASAGKYRVGDRPNTEAIGKAVNDAANEFLVRRYGVVPPRSTRNSAQR